MDGYELLTRSAMAYGAAESYLDAGTITIDQPSRRSEYTFQTLSERDEEFYYQLLGGAGARFQELRVTKAGQRYETVQSGSFGQAATLEEAIQPLLDIATYYTTAVPRILEGFSWGPSNEIMGVEILGVTTVSGQEAIILEIDLIEGGRATIWLDQATLLIRRMTHESPRTSETLVTVAFTRLEAL